VGIRVASKLVGLVLAGGFFVSPVVWADDAGQGSCGTSVTAEILGILRDAGNIDQSRYEALCAKARSDDEAPPVSAAPAVSAPAVTAPAVSAPADEGKPTWSFKWSNGFKLSRSDGAYKLKFGGRAMLDSAYIWASDDLKSTLAPEGSGVEFRRARIFFSGTVYDRVFFKMQYEFAKDDDPNDPSFKDVYMGLKKLGPIRSIQVGHFKEPFMLQEWTSSKNMTFMERGLNNAFYPGRNVGIMGMGNGFDKKLFWQLGLFREADDQGFAFEDWGDAAYDLAARVVAAPVYADDGARVLHLGVDYIHRFNQDGRGRIRLRQRPETHFSDRLVDTDASSTDSFFALDASSSDILNLEAAVVYGPFSAQTEWTFDWVEGAGAQQNVAFWGGYVFVSYFLTGEHRNYDKGHGRFGRVRPKRNFDPFNGDWGAWEVAARYSILDLSDRNVRGGVLWDVTAGINWYLFPNLRWMLNYVHGDVRDRTQWLAAGPRSIRGSEDILETRFQVDF